MSEVFVAALYRFGLFWSHAEIQDGLGGDDVVFLSHLQEETTAFNMFTREMYRNVKYDFETRFAQAAHPSSQGLLIGDGLSFRPFAGLLVCWRCSIGGEPPEEREVGQSQRNLQGVAERHLHYDRLCGDRRGELRGRNRTESFLLS